MKLVLSVPLNSLPHQQRSELSFNVLTYASLAFTCSSSSISGNIMTTYLVTTIPPWSGLFFFSFFLLNSFWKKIIQLTTVSKVLYDLETWLTKIILEIQEPTSYNRKCKCYSVKNYIPITLMRFFTSISALVLHYKWQL